MSMIWVACDKGSRAKNIPANLWHNDRWLLESSAPAIEADFKASVCNKNKRPLQGRTFKVPYTYQVPYVLFEYVNGGKEREITGGSSIHLLGILEKRLGFESKLVYMDTYMETLPNGTSIGMIPEVFELTSFQRSILFKKYIFFLSR